MRPATALCFALVLAPMAAIAADPMRSVFGVDAASVADVIDDDRNVSLASGKSVRLPTTKGVIVLGVSPYGPAHGKLEGLDLIDRVGREPVADMAAFTELVSKLPAGEPVRLAIRRLELAGERSKTNAGFYKRERVELAPIAWEDLIRAAMAEDRLPTSGAVRYTHREAPPFDGPTGLDVFFVVDPDESVSCYLNIRLKTDDWIFIDRWTIDVDGSQFEIPGEALQISRDIKGPDNLREWEVVTVDAKLATLVNRLEGPKRVAVTFHGKDTYSTAELDGENLARLRGEVAAARVQGWKAAEK